MKTIIVLFSVLISMQAFAGYKCSATKWRPGVGDKYYSLSAFPKSFQVEDGQKNGYLRGFDLSSENVSYGKVDYVLNGQVECIENDCSLNGTVTEIVHGSEGNASGFSGMFSVHINGEDEQFIPMVEGKVLKIKCKNN